MDRQRAIEILSDMADICAGMQIRLSHDDISAIKMGLRSLQVDEIYQLMYEDPNDVISRSQLLSDIARLKKSCWFNRGKHSPNLIQNIGFQERKEAIEIIEDLCVKKIKNITEKISKGDEC